jgi:hypothetical protein
MSTQLQPTRHPLKELTAQLEVALSDGGGLPPDLTSMLRFLSGLKKEELEMALSGARG